MYYQKKIKRMIEEAIFNEYMEKPEISSFIRQLSKKFNFKKIDKNRLSLTQKSDIPKLQEYLREMGWKQSKMRKDNWFKGEIILRLDSTGGYLQITNNI